MPPHPVTNFEIQKYYQSEPKLHGVYSRSNLSKIKYGAYLINLDWFALIGNHWIALYMNGNNMICFIDLELNIFQKKLKNL